MRRKSVLYYIFKPLVNWACRLFYRNLHIRNSNQLSSTDAPVLLVSNHQNALIDPLLCCISSPEQLNFLTRADVFKKPWAKKLLFNLNMLPVYRPHDRVNIIESNAPTFRESLNRLENNQIISLFPEGTHQKDQNLKPFKKGAARLIADLFEAGKSEKIIIQPVGLHFTNIMHSGYPGFVHFGVQEEIKATDLDLGAKNRARTLNNMTIRLNQLLEKNMIHIDDDEHYTKKLFIFRAQQWHILFSKRQSSILEFKTLENTLINHLETLSEFSDSQIQQIEESSFDMPALVLAANDQLRKKFSRKLLALIPIYLIGTIGTIIPYLLGKSLSQKMVKDVCFTSTAKIVIGAILMPIFWSLVLVVLLIYLNVWQALVLFIPIVFCGAIFLKYNTSYRILARSNTLRRQSGFRALISAVKQVI